MVLTAYLRRFQTKPSRVVPARLFPKVENLVAIENNLAYLTTNYIYIVRFSLGFDSSDLQFLSI